jgi:hypothetical protein
MFFAVVSHNSHYHSCKQMPKNLLQWPQTSTTSGLYPCQFIAEPGLPGFAITGFKALKWRLFAAAEVRRSVTGNS